VIDNFLHRGNQTLTLRIIRILHGKRDVKHILEGEMGG